MLDLYVDSKIQFALSGKKWVKVDLLFYLE